MEDGFNYLNTLTWGYRASRVLQAAVGLKVFTHLAEKEQTSQELAAACEAKAEPLEKLLIACCAMGLLEKTNGVYRNTELSDHYLVEGRPLYQGSIIAHAERVWDFWSALPDDILLAPVPKDPSQQHRDFILGMHNITMGGRGQLFLDHVNLSGRKKLFDVGGGPGTYSILACREYPELHATVFDLPETIAIAQEIIEKEGMADRVSICEGNWETDDFGSDNDVVLFSNVLHGPDSMAALKLNKAFASLIPGGLVAIQEFALNDTKTGPLVPALFNVMVGAYSKTELCDEMTKAGFVNPRTVTESEEIGCAWITAVKP